MSSEEISEEVKRKYIELQSLNEQFKQVQERLEKVEDQHSELMQVISDIEEVKDIKKDSESYVPVHNGIFLKAKIIDNKKLHVNVGNGTVVEKTIDEVKEVLAKQAGEIDNVKEDMQEKLQQMIARMQTLEKDLSVHFG